ncbi:DUF5329 family protein [uncultured Pontibacter sp.]|uniref:DUF5329 family protein n=1 Tax=uncultured Pontibacter sp. TaxID=453356 RepID=UPI002612F6E4|nr:DUF5329 family protein [uncultured Pontibacter sp.]
MAKAPMGNAGDINYRAAAELTESQKVERLILFIKSLKDATFVRNGSEHTCEQAAEHLQSKWEKHRNKIQSARAFIEDLASKSGLSGQPYLIRFKDGTELTTNAVLNQELERLEAM